MKPIDEIELISTFLMLVKEESLRKAGSRLGLTGTAVRDRIRRLEQHIGLALVHIYPRGDCVPTFAGRQLHERCAPSGDLLASAWTLSVQALTKPRLSIASTGIGIRFRLPQILQLWRSKGLYNDIPVEIRRVKASEIPSVVMAGEVRFGIGRMIPPDQHHPLLHIESFRGSKTAIAFAKSREIDLPDRSVVAINKHIGWVLPYDTETGLRVLREVLEISGEGSPKITHWVGNYEDAALYAANGFGATLMPEPFVAPHREMLAPLIFPENICDQDREFPGCFMWRDDVGLRAAWELHFVEAFREHRPAW